MANHLRAELLLEALNIDVAVLEAVRLLKKRGLNVLASFCGEFMANASDDVLVKSAEHGRRLFEEFVRNHRLEDIVTYHGTVVGEEEARHLRTTDVIESPFATVRLRQRVTKGTGSRRKGLLMAFKLLDMAQQRWRRLNGSELVAFARAGVKFVDGIREERDNQEERDAA
jgi:hypothetical protein